MSSESPSSALDPARRPALSSSTNRARFIASTVHSTPRWRAASAAVFRPESSQHASLIGCESIAVTTAQPSLCERSQSVGCWVAARGRGPALFRQEPSDPGPDFVADLPNHLDRLTL